MNNELQRRIQTRWGRCPQTPPPHDLNEELRAWVVETRRTERLLTRLMLAGVAVLVVATLYRTLAMGVCQ